MFKVIRKDNLNNEHLCCSLSKNDEGIKLKKTWLKDRLDEGLVFRKLDERGKVFIEYIDAEYAFSPIHAPNYLYINCFWVSGKFKGKGYGKALLESCIEDAKIRGRDGIVVLSSKKKKPFLSDPKFLKAKGFEVCDEALDYELLYYKLSDTKPKFLDHVGQSIGNKLYYTHQCPFTEKYVKMVKEASDELGIDLEVIYLDTPQAAKKAPCPFTTYSLYLNGEFVTNEILTVKKYTELVKPLL